MRPASHPTPKMSMDSGSRCSVHFSLAFSLGHCVTHLVQRRLGVQRVSDIYEYAPQQNVFVLLLSTESNGHRSKQRESRAKTLSGKEVFVLWSFAIPNHDIRKTGLQGSRGSPKTPVHLNFAKTLTSKFCGAGAAFSFEVFTKGSGFLLPNLVSSLGPNL